MERDPLLRYGVDPYLVAIRGPDYREETELDQDLDTLKLMTDEDLLHVFHYTNMKKTQESSRVILYLRIAERMGGIHA
jgi:hypothetical protein